MAAARSDLAHLLRLAVLDRPRARGVVESPRGRNRGAGDMTVRVEPADGQRYASVAEALAAWHAGSPFRVADRWHPDYTRRVTRWTLPEPVRVLRQADTPSQR